MRTSADELTINADTAEIRRASGWLEQSALEQGVPADQIGRLELCLNEALANVITHGKSVAQSLPILLALQVRREPPRNKVTVTISDSGTAFNPLALAQKEKPRTLAEAVPGGLGILMIRSMADTVRYHYRDGRNQLSFSVLWVEAS